jgi:hypothetical protein
MFCGMAAPRPNCADILAPPCRNEKRRSPGAAPLYKTRERYVLTTLQWQTPAMPSQYDNATTATSAAPTHSAIHSSPGSEFST